MSVSQGELVEAAVTSGLIDADTVANLRVEARRRREQLLDLMSRHGRFPMAAVYRALAEVRALPFIDLGVTLPDKELVRKVPESILRKHQVVPVSQREGETVVATANPDDRAVGPVLERFLGQRVQLALTDPESIEPTIDRVLQGLRDGPSPTAAPAVDPVALLDRVMKEAYLRRASDIHLEPEANGMRIRLRIDGRLVVYMAGLDPETGSILMSRVKVLADLNIAEQRAPQDGRFTYEPPAMGGKSIDIRVATMPTRWGERATLRLLGSDTGELSLEALGMSSRELERFRSAIRRPYGIILLTGPTGSGKTTTLYAAIREINKPHLNILTVEDPVEYLISGVSQVHVGWTDKVTLASALRSLLRHDPDVLMVGEIRDQETADVALKAAMTGHLMFSTLHTNTACGAITRLIDIGAEPFLIGSTLTGVIAQRLVRRLCQRCRKPRPATTLERHVLGAKDDDEEVILYDPVGCPNCLGSGYRGRIGLFEPLWIDHELARLISRGVSQADVEAHVAPTLTTLRADGCAKAREGITTLDEVLTATVLEA
ncbi:MAG: GspE/PulE family protein [Gemmataceae bacterium]